MAEYLTYREAAARTRRSIRTINRWRRGGMPMQWETREGQRVRVVEKAVLLKWWRQRMDAWPPHQQKLRVQRRELNASEQTRHARES